MIVIFDCAGGNFTFSLPKGRQKKKKVFSLLEFMVSLFMRKGARIYNREKTVASISGAGKTGQLCVKE